MQIGTNQEPNQHFHRTNKGLVWSEEKLESFLEEPRRSLKKTVGNIIRLAWLRVLMVLFNDPMFRTRNL